MGILKQLGGSNQHPLQERQRRVGSVVDDGGEAECGSGLKLLIVLA